MDVVTRLRALAENLFWVWHPEAMQVFHDLNPDLWRQVNHNPTNFLAHLTERDIADKAAMLALESRITYASHILQDYMRDADTWGNHYAGPLRAAPVAYFSAEFGLHESLPTYAGGLGVLAGDHLKAASDLGIPLVGVGLFYAKGYFRQRLNASGRQEEDYSAVDVNLLPLARARDSRGQQLRVSVQTRDAGTIWVAAWTAEVGRTRLVLLDTNVSDNTDEVKALTSHLYGGDQRVRILQELVLGVGGLRVLEAMGILPGVVHMNEGHSAFAVLELTRRLMERDGQSFPNMRERAASMCVFTTHTPVEAGHDRFAPHLVEQTLGPLRQQMHLSEADLMALGRVDPGNHGEPFCMTVLGLKMSRARNAVSALHARITRAMWHSLWPNREEADVPVHYITNGVHVATWLAPEMDRMFSRWLGEGWAKQMDDPRAWQAIEQVDDEEFWELSQILKARMITFVRRRLGRQNEARGEPPDKGHEGRPALDPAVLTIGFARRFAQYKRGDLLLHDLDRLNRLINHPERPVQMVFGGKAHPGDGPGKAVIQRVFQVTRDPRFAGRIVFIEDYDINVGRHMVQGVDVWMNNPRRPLEACGTSGEKAVLNGTLNLSVLDGWWAEAYDGTNGFAIGKGGEHSDWDRQDRLDTEALYSVLENEVVPMFYNRCPVGIPREWVARQKNALRTLAPRFGAHRMVKEYTLSCYLPAVGGPTSSFPAAVLACK